jgi:hypothetical protein
MSRRCRSWNGFWTRIATLFAACLLVGLWGGHPIATGGSALLSRASRVITPSEGSFNSACPPIISCNCPPIVNCTCPPMSPPAAEPPKCPDCVVDCPDLLDLFDDQGACIKYRSGTYAPPAPLSNASEVMIGGRSIHIVVVGPRADQITKQHRPLIQAWREKATQQGWAFHLHLNQEVEELIDGYYPHYRVTYDRLMAYKPIAAADFAR